MTDLIVYQKTIIFKAPETNLTVIQKNNTIHFNAPTTIGPGGGGGTQYWRLDSFTLKPTSSYDIDIGGNSFIGKDVDLSGDVNAEGDANISGDANVSGNVYANDGYFNNIYYTTISPPCILLDGSNSGDVSGDLNLYQNKVYTGGDQNNFTLWRNDDFVQLSVDPNGDTQISMSGNAHWLPAYAYSGTGKNQYIGGGAVLTTGTGGDVTVHGGDAIGFGGANANGGNYYARGGLKSGTGVAGKFFVSGLVDFTGITDWVTLHTLLDINVGSGSGALLLKKTAGTENIFEVQNSSGVAQLYIDYTNQLAFKTLNGPIYFGAFGAPAQSLAGFSTPSHVMSCMDATTRRCGFGGDLTWFTDQGGTPPLALVDIRGKADEVQLRLKAWSTQTSDIIDVRTSAGAEGGLFKLTNDGNATAVKFTSTVATGTSPYACTSPTLNTNLNADLLDGNHASSFAQYSFGANNFSGTGDFITTGGVTGGPIGVYGDVSTSFGAGFNQTNSIDFGNNAALNLSTYTVAVWYNPTSFPYLSTVIDTELYGIGVFGDGHWEAKNYVNYGNTPAMVGGTLSAGTGTWSLLIIRRSGSTMNCWQDNGSTVNTNYTITMPDGTFQRLTMGTDASGYGRACDGAADEPLIYNRVLSDAECLAIWNGGVGTYTPPTSGLLFGCHFNRGYEDFSGHGNNGTQSGGVTLYYSPIANAPGGSVKTTKYFTYADGLLFDGSAVSNWTGSQVLTPAIATARIILYGASDDTHTLLQVPGINGLSIGGLPFYFDTNNNFSIGTPLSNYMSNILSIGQGNSPYHNSSAVLYGNNIAAYDASGSAMFGNNINGNGHTNVGIFGESGFATADYQISLCGYNATSSVYEQWFTSTYDPSLYSNHIQLGNMPITNYGLSSGDLFVTDAATAVANNYNVVCRN
jgi:hypothetical protein